MTAGIGAADAAIYTGICVENTDPTGQGRIQYCVPQLSGTESFGWAAPVYPGFTPIESYVYIAFEGGDRNRPLYWPSQLPATSYSTYSAMVAANPAATTPVGATFYIVDHGGNIQLQNNGITSTSTSWQWLPSGAQGAATSTADISATGSTANLVTYLSLNNPSTNRRYRITIDSVVWGSGSALLAGLGVYVTTSTPPSTLPAFTTSWLVARSAGVGNNGAGVSAGSGISLAYSHVVTGLTTGTINVAAYLINNYASGTAVTTSSGTTQLGVDDIGAVT